MKIRKKKQSLFCIKKGGSIGSNKGNFSDLFDDLILSKLITKIRWLSSFYTHETQTHNAVCSSTKLRSLNHSSKPHETYITSNMNENKKWAPSQASSCWILTLINNTETDFCWLTFYFVTCSSIEKWFYYKCQVYLQGETTLAKYK